MGWFFASGTLGLIAEYFLKTTIILTLAMLAAAASKRRPAAFRHFVLSLALIGLLLLPVLSLAPVGWKTSLLPARPAPLGGQELTQNVRNSLSEPVEIPESSLSMFAGGTNERPAGFPGLGAKFRPDESMSHQPPEMSYSSLLNAREDSGVRGILLIAIITLWSAGLVILVLRLVIGLSGAIKLTKEGTALADPVWHLLFKRFLALVSLRRKIRLKSHPQVFVPLTWGWRKPVILMPADTDAWTDEERSSALFHELSHVKRADFLVMLLVRMSLAVFWWNPLCWIVYRELRREQEIACDELVLRAGIKPSIYAASLLAFRRSAGFRWNTSAALLGMLGKPSFNVRLSTILIQKLTLKEVKMKTKIMLAAAVVLAVALVGTARPAVGIENRAAEPPAVETVASAPGSVDVALPAAETQEKVAEKPAAQEKEKEKVKVAVEAKPAVERKIVIEAKEGAKVIYYVAPKFAPGGNVRIIKEGKDEKGGAYVVVRPVIEAKPTITWTIKEPTKEGTLLVTKEFSGKPFVGKWISEDGKTRVFSAARDKELIEKVREIREQVAAVKEKKTDFTSLEKSLEKLEAMLKPSEEKLSKLEIKVGKEPGAGADEAATIQLVATGKAGKEGREAYDRAVAKLKNELPEGTKLLEQNYDEESGAMTFIITAPKGEKDNEALIKKLADDLKTEVKK